MYQTGMLGQVFKIGIGYQFCEVWRSTDCLLNIFHMFLLVLLCLYQPRFLLWVFCLGFFLCGISNPYFPFMSSQDCHIITPDIFLFIFSWSSWSIFFQNDLLSIFVSFHIISLLKFFLLLKCFFLFKSSCFLKIFKKLKDVKFDWTILIHASVSFTLRALM